MLNLRMIDQLGRSLDASAMRQNVYANNIANVDTPHYKRSDVLFETLLQEQLYENGSRFVGRRTHPRHLHIGASAHQPVQARVVTDHKSRMNNNGNNVDIDYEMSLVAKNQLFYNTLIQQLNHEIRMTRTAIDGRR